MTAGTQTATICIALNGRETNLPPGTTIAALLEQHNLQPIRVAVEVNEDIVRRARFAEHVLQDGDRVEIVTFVGGG